MQNNDERSKRLQSPTFVTKLNKADYVRNKKDYDNRGKAFYPKKSEQTETSRLFYEQWN